MEWAAQLARIYSAAKLSEDPLFPSLTSLFFTRLRRWRERLRWARHRLNAAPPAIRIVVLAATVLAVFSVANVVYQLVRKPTEIFFPVSRRDEQVTGWRSPTKASRSTDGTRRPKLRFARDIPAGGSRI